MNKTFTFLRTIPLFTELNDPDLEKICREVQEVRLQPGEILFEEGSIGQQAYVIHEGQIEIYKSSNGPDVQLAVRQAGEMIGEISLLESTPRNASGRALTASVLYAIGQEQFDNLLNTSPSAARAMLHTVIMRLRSMDMALNQSEKMAQLGTLTAGIAHELNNPASAVKRGAEQFKLSFAAFQEQIAILQKLNLSSDHWNLLRKLADRPGAEKFLDPIERNDREGSFEDWLDENGVKNGWEMAPLLVNRGYEPETLKQELASFPADTFPAVVAWIASSAALENISAEINQGAGRISEIVKALKSYVYLDQAPVQIVSIQEGLENTLVILRHKLNQGVEIERVYDPSIPLIQAYGSELNQVWTNILDNAIDAMDGRGKITIRTSYQKPWIVVDIADTGPGIPPEIQSKVFSPFFTTKPLGKGTGLGLNISYNIIRRHGGDVKVRSQPGNTHFEVWLPEKLKNEAGTHARTNGSAANDEEDEQS